MAYQHKKEDLCEALSSRVYNSTMSAREQWRIENEGLILSPEARFQPITEREFRRLRLLNSCTPVREMGRLLMLHDLDVLCEHEDRHSYMIDVLGRYNIALADGTATEADRPDELTTDEFWALKIFKCPWLPEPPPEMIDLEVDPSAFYTPPAPEKREWREVVEPEPTEPPDREYSPRELDLGSVFREAERKQALELEQAMSQDRRARVKAIAWAAVGGVAILGGAIWLAFTRK